ncbi:polysaccharide deacetylase family protein [Paenibacillus sp. IB182496]|uniref:Polysaccharide deacetylase family protein n=1 Tax=Paenibacillus sabuli TaxID=2772509 RepID=A0A927GU82_9BACL|nr:polysaccharide deacetylase family protein [Paenibacillus sabuli]MBD2847442.1 polysaccharide deacetylase family protein [Paenibacillus sabuli]
MMDNQRRNRILPITVTLLLLTILQLLTGCSGSKASGPGNGGAGQSQAVPQPTEMSRVIDSVYTTERALALTFNGMGDEERMDRLLQKLDDYGIKASFFLPGMRVAEEPDIARRIAAHGHELEAGTLNREAIEGLNYEQLEREVRLDLQVLREHTEADPRYVRSSWGEVSDALRYAAEAGGLRAVVGQTLFLHNWQEETEEERRTLIRNYVQRGAILALDTEENEDLLANVKRIAEAAEAVGYAFVTLEELDAKGGARLAGDEVPGYDAALLDSDAGAGADYRLWRGAAQSGDDAAEMTSRHATGQADEQAEKQAIAQADEQAGGRATDNAGAGSAADRSENGGASRAVALTFDDWGSDAAITPILDVLAEYEVRASFFLRADGVVRNPNLARAIAEAGHDVGNHTYSHPVITELTTQQLQQEIVQAHRIIAEAIQQPPAMLFRPPTGAFEPEDLAAIAATGYRDIVLFDVDPEDYKRERTAQQIVDATLAQAQGGSLVLLHLLDGTHTADALPGIIEGLRARGYAIEPVSALLEGYTD